MAGHGDATCLLEAACLKDYWPGFWKVKCRKIQSTCCDEQQDDGKSMTNTLESAARQLLVVDDEPDIADFIRDVALDVGFEAQSVHLAGQFEQQYTESLDVIIMDLVMPERDGVELLRFLAERRSTATIVLISGYDQGVLHSAQKLAFEQGLNVVATLTKPILYRELEQLLLSIPSSAVGAGSHPSPVSGEPSEQELRRALKERELVVCFQPKVHLCDGLLAGVEALVRWRHPQRGLLMPNAIIPLAERTGLMDALTLEVLEQSFRQASEWLGKGLRTQVAVNMSAGNFKDLELPEWISGKIQEYGLQPQQIALEVTETTLMYELVKSLDILTRLRMKGLELSIDDFGTGYSSLLQLYRIPFSELKIDRSFVMKAATDTEARTIVEMTILLGQKLNMKVVAEGVETKETWKLLSGLGCNLAQGYWIAKPMPGSHLIDWLKQRQGSVD
jgi:EAL domain-containing protein (putative c-di-GMP-specific phosphodiesterase class I)